MEWPFIFALTSTVLIKQVLADHCPEGHWINVDGTCYLFSSQKLKYQEAIDECRKLSADSLNFYSKDEKAKFLEVTSVMNIERWWTSLNDKNSPGTFVWGGASQGIRPDDGIILWNIEPDDTKHIENCGAINIQAAVSDEVCNERHGYICEYPITSDGCLDGWAAFNKSCYLIGDVQDPFSNMHWSAAKDYCIKSAPGKGAHLLQLENKIETDYLNHQLPFIQTTSGLWWIGMTDKKQEGHWYWLDGTAVQQQSIQWEVEPNNLGGNEHCAMMYYSGVFADKNCDELAYYVCRTQQVGDSSIRNKLGCPLGWIRAGHKCYSFKLDDSKKWSDAVATCQSYGANLIQIETKDEKSWIELQTRYYKASAFWSGLNYHLKDKNWYWSTGIKADMNLIKWNSEPNNYAGNEDCGEILQDGVFNDNSCLSKSKYICEMHQEDAPCPSGWFTSQGVDFDSCYFISNDTDLALWEEAIDKCLQIAQPYAATLVAFDTQDELTKVTAFLQQVPPNPFGWWTGLNDRKKEGEWVYYTSYDNPRGGSNVKINWNSEPSNPEKDRCAVLYFGGRYNDISCANNLSYICEKPAQKYPYQTSNGFQYLPFYLNTIMMLIVCWLY